MKKQALLASAAAFVGSSTVAAYAQEEEFPPEADQIFVTASPVERTVGETILNSSIVEKEELQRRLENSIGETLRREPGISSTFFGPGASRPIIRGLGASRIRVLDAGIGSIDVSATSPDHAVAVEPATAEKIEVLRGPATLLYGSSAAGGVVNVFNGRIPSETPEDGIDGAVRIGGSTADEGIEAAGGFDVLLGSFNGGSLVFHGDGFYREAEDYDIPGFAESERLRAAEEAEEDHGADDDDHDHEEEEEVFGVAENSSLKTKGGSAGLSWIFENGFFGISGSATNTTYGVPGEHGHHEEEHGDDDDDHGDDDHDEEEEEEGGVTIDLKQRRLDLQGELRGDFALFEKIKVRAGYADYEHAEFEPNGEQGTLFTNEGWETRLELVDKPFDFAGGEVNGAVGFQYRKSAFAAVGEEAFVPPTDTNQFGLFGLKEWEAGLWRLELGARYEHTNHDVQEMPMERSFDTISVSAGAGFKPMENVFLGVTGYRTERAPSTEELFSNGPHLATSSFEIGDRTLGIETARGVEATARYSTEKFSASINGYYTSYNDFIYEMATGVEMDELPVFQFVAEDATFRGFEAAVQGEVFTMGPFDVHADAGIDYVRATTDATGNDNLPRIPPFSGLFGLEARSNCFDFRAELEYAGDQDDVSDFELPTDGYEVFNAFVTWRPFPDTAGLAVRVSGNNLTDEEVRFHSSFVKDLAPSYGRNVKVSVQGTF